MKASERYLKAASRIEDQTMCGCCCAIESTGLSTKKFLTLMSPNQFLDQSGSFFFGRCKCWTNEHIPVRVLALCFMAAIAEDEERARKRSPR